MKLLIHPKLTLNRLTYQISFSRAKRTPVYVFHHIPKCGGTSVVKALSAWFRPVLDYRQGWSDTYNKSIPLKNLTSRHCLCGHFDHSPIYLNERYPEILGNPDFRVFTFIRDPLAAKLSLYRYEQKHNRTELPLENFLLERPNYLAHRFPVTTETLQAALDRYYFVGTVENLQKCLDWIAADAGMTPQVLPWRNRTDISNAPTITPDLINRFKHENTLDYSLYEYAKKREALLLSQEPAGHSA